MYARVTLRSYGFVTLKVVSLCPSSINFWHYGSFWIIWEKAYLTDFRGRISRAGKIDACS